MPDTYSDIEDRISNALQCLQQSKHPNVAAVAKELDVPYKRLLARFNGRKSRSTRPPTNRKLTEEQEGALCQYLDSLDDIYISATRKQCSATANLLLMRAHGSQPGSPPTVGEHWVTKFLKRHPEYYIRTQKPLNIDRQISQDPDDIASWYERLGRKIAEKGITPRNIWNFDETGFRIGCAKPAKVITRHPNRRNVIPSSENRKWVSVVETINGDGAAQVPPMVILPGEMHLQAWHCNTMPGTWLMGVSETGYSNDDLALAWIKHFSRYTRGQRDGAYILLLFDGAYEHCTRQFLEVCEENKIIPFCFPPHTTHFLQPLDVVVFQPYKHWHGEAVNEALRTGCTNFNQVEFLAQLWEIHENTFKISTIKASWRETGFVPWNPALVVEKLRTKGVPPATPPPTEPPSNHTPHELSSLVRRTHYIQDLSLSPSLRRPLLPVLKAGLVAAEANELYKHQLAKTEAAEKARQLRQTQPRRMTQRGGVLYAQAAREITRKRDQKDAEMEARRHARQAKKQRGAQPEEIFDNINVAQPPISIE